MVYIWKHGRWTAAITVIFASSNWNTLMVLNLLMLLLLLILSKWLALFPTFIFMVVGPSVVMAFQDLGCQMLLADGAPRRICNQIISRWCRDIGRLIAPR